MNIEETAKKEWDNLQAAFQWSSLYSANSFELKLKELSMTEKIKKELGKCIKDNLKELCEIEQNRWNIEKLLLGFRKPHKDEQKEIDIDRKNGLGNKKFKDFKEYHIHDLIRPYKELASIKWKEENNSDGTVIYKDASKTNIDMIESIPIIEDVITMRKKYN